MVLMLCKGCHSSSPWPLVRLPSSTERLTSSKPSHALAYHSLLSSRFRERQAGAPDPDHGAFFSPVSTPYVFVWTRNNLCVCAQGAGKKRLPVRTVWKGWLSHRGGRGGRQSLLGLCKQAGLCSCSGEIRHVKCLSQLFQLDLLPELSVSMAIRETST